jgi:hypothetical protein
MARRRKKPNQEAALDELDHLLQNPPQAAQSPLEIFVNANYPKLITAVEQGHSLTQIGAVLRRQGISSTPKLLRAAVYQAAVANHVLDQLPEKLKPTREDGEAEAAGQPTPIANLSEDDATETESAPASPITRLPVPETRNSKLAY